MNIGYGLLEFSHTQNRSSPGAVANVHTQETENLINFETDLRQNVIRYVLQPLTFSRNSKEKEKIVHAVLWTERNLLRILNVTVFQRQRGQSWFLGKCGRSGLFIEDPRLLKWFSFKKSVITDYFNNGRNDGNRINP